MSLTLDTNKEKTYSKIWKNWHPLNTHKVSLFFLFLIEKCQRGRYSVNVIILLLLWKNK